MASPSPVPSTARIRWALLASFALFGVIMTLWVSRLPSAQAILGVTNAQLGTLLVAGSVGALVMVLTSGALVTRFGSTAVMLGAIMTFIVATILIATSLVTQQIWLFAVGLVLSGMAGPTANIPLNTNAAALSTQIGRPLLPQFHAAFSIGAVAGSLGGALLSRLGVDVALQLLATAALVGGARIALVKVTCWPTRNDHLSGLDDESMPRRGGWRSAAAAWLDPRTLLIGVVVFSASLSEGSATNWLSLAVVQGFGVKEAIGAAVLATFTAAMTLIRLNGPRIIKRFGGHVVVMVSAVVSIAGLAAFGFGPGLAIAWIGVAAWGMGAALTTPIAIAAAADDPTQAAARVAVVTSFSSIAGLAAPPTLGYFIDLIGPRHTLAAIGVVLLAGIAAAPALRPRPPQRA